MKPPECRLAARREKPSRETSVSFAQTPARMYRSKARDNWSIEIDGKKGATMRACSFAALLDSQACVRAMARVMRVNASRWWCMPCGVTVKVVYEVGPRLL